MRLDVKFPPPGFFLNDPRLVITLDERTIYDGSFRAGVDVSLEVAPGRHVVHTAVHIAGSLAQKQRIELALGANDGYRDVPAVEAVLEYSRLSGNFKPRASLSARR